MSLENRLNAGLAYFLTMSQKCTEAHKLDSIYHKTFNLNNSASSSY